MNEHNAPLILRAASDFGSTDDFSDLRTPEQRAGEDREKMQEYAWKRLPFACAINLVLMIWLSLIQTLGPALLASCIVALTIGSLLALSPLARRDPAIPWRTFILHAEAMVSALGIALSTLSPGWLTLSVAGIALVANPIARCGLSAWAHLIVLGGGALLAGFDFDPRAVFAVLALCAVSAAHGVYVSKQHKLNLTRTREVSELTALCQQLAQNRKQDDVPRQCVP